MFSYRRLSFILILTTAGVFAASPADIEKRIDALLAKMTVEEKIGQMSQQSMGPVNDKLKDEIRKGRWGSFLNAGTPQDRVELQRIAVKESRLGHPADLRPRRDPRLPDGVSDSAGPGGVLGSRPVRQAARVAGREAAMSGYHWTFAPMLDITRDPRWGRIAETLGEDPYLTSMLGAAMVRGFQGDKLDSAGLDRGVRQALRRLRRRGGRPRLQHHLDSRTSAARRVTCRRSQPRATPASPPS